MFHHYLHAYNWAHGEGDIIDLSCSSPQVTLICV